jgi:hypothetical protein
MKTKYISLALICSMLMFGGSFAHAFDAVDRAAMVENIFSGMDAARAESISEIDTILQALVSEGYQDTYSTDGNELIVIGYDIAGAYKVVVLEPMLLEKLNGSNSFSSAFTDTVQWKIPITMSDSSIGLAVINEVGGALSLTGTVVGDATRIWQINKEKVLTAVADADIVDESIASIQMAHSYLHNTVFVLLNGENDEYVIPYSYNASQMGVENGKVYSFDSIMNILNDNIDEASIMQYPDNNGGAPYRQQSVQQPQAATLISTPIATLTVAISLLLLGAIVIYRKKLRKSAQAQAAPTHAETPRDNCP